MRRPPQIALRATLAVLFLIILLYASDFVWVKYRILKNTPGDPLQQIQVQTTYAIPHKDGRAEYVFGPRETQTCVRAIFPQLGYPPCWYLKRNANQQIPM